ncbi:MAG: FKBP-type peptidyl-prolyl cis-trans isomerase [Proteobacteria bacterium]|nr:FKBP-type peptidyl-prolyl cis-trans isomerase [Pseudomonadota bacterium]HQR03163.1 FKBP-type peptidyl-prolyl cis-trans isomerase [Rhodocyclaceae bacterium]
MAAQVQSDSFLTLHYRLSADGNEMVSTFGAAPATLLMGSGQLAPPLEQCLLQMGEGDHRVFDLPASQAFGVRKDDLVQRVSRSQIPPTVLVEPMAQVDFMSHDGHPYSGLVREADAEGVLIDFNHPLSGKSLRFEARIIGVL